MMIINMVVADFVSLPLFLLKISLKTLFPIKSKIANKTITLYKQNDYNKRMVASKSRTTEYILSIN